MNWRAGILLVALTLLAGVQVAAGSSPAENVESEPTTVQAASGDAALQAEEEPASARPAQQDDDDGAGVPGYCKRDDHPQIGKLAEQTGESEETIAELLCEDGLTPGQIRQDYGIADDDDDDDGAGVPGYCKRDDHPQIGKLAEQTGESEETIAELLCEEGLTPGQIRQDYGIADDDDDDDGAGVPGYCKRDDHPQIGKLADDLDASEDQVAEWLCEDGLSPGTIRVAHRVADEADASLDEVLALHAEGLGWGQIREELGD